MKRATLLIFLLSAISIFVNAQSAIEGKVTDSQTGEAIIFGNVSLFKGDSLLAGASTQLNGDFHIGGLQPGNYAIEVAYVGYTKQKLTDIRVKQNDTLRLAIQMSMKAIILDEVEVVEYEMPLIDRDMARSTAVLHSKSSGISIKTRGSRTANIQYYTDGVAGHLKNGNDRNAANTEDYDLIVENRFLRATDEPLSTFSIDADGASYSNLRRYLMNGSLPPRDAVRIEEMVNYFEYDYSQPANDDPFSIITEVQDCPWNAQHKLVHIGLQGVEIPTDDLPNSNLVFLLDVSGSMSAPNKLPLVKESFKLLTGQLRENDRVAIVVYAGSSGLVLPSTSGSDSQAILDALQKLQAGGSTAGAAGIQLAYDVARENFIKGGNNRVILATDGDFNVGVSSDAELVRIIEKERESGVFLSVLGFGMGNYKDNKMQQLANKGNGNHSYIDNISEARKVFVNEFGGTLFAIAKDVKIQVEFNPNTVQGYRLIGYENRLLNNEDFKDDKKDAGEIGSGHSVTALYEVIPTGVETDLLAEMDELRFQKKKRSNASSGDEMLWVKVRYKDPNGGKSKQIDQLVPNKNTSSVSENFNWAASVACFGLILRESEFKGNANMKMARELAQAGIGADRHGYRKEFIDLLNGVNRTERLEVSLGR